MNRQKKSKNKKTFFPGGIISIICILIYMFALAQAAVRAYLSIEQRKNTAEQEFIQIKALALTSGNAGFMNEAFIETINNALASSKAIEALIISGPDGEYAFERNKGKAVTWVNNSPRFIKRFDLSSQPLWEPLQIQGLRNVNIQAAAGAFDYNSFTKILRETLFLILTGIILAFFTMLINLLRGKQADVSIEYTELPEETVEHIDFPDELPVTVNREPPAPVPIEPLAVALKEAPVIIPSAPAIEIEPRQHTAVLPAQEEEGLPFNVKEVLELELHRCASMENDMVFILIEFKDKISNTYHKIKEEAECFFFTKDIFLDYKEQGISIVYPEVNLDTALAKSREFLHNLTYKPVYIGLTSRSGRLVNSQRIMFEAEQALARAKSDPSSPIIAFKSDPDKYRAFISKGRR